MGVAVRTATRVQDQDDVSMTPAVGVDEYALVYDHDTGKFVAGGRQKIVHGWTGAKAANDYQLLIQNVNEDASGPDDYQNEVHLRLRAGTTANHRRYIDWTDYQGVNKWYFGINASNVGIRYDVDGPVHREWLVPGGSSYLCSAGSGAFYINYHTSDTVGTGGLIVHGGGAPATNIRLLFVTNGGIADAETILYINSGQTGTYSARLYFQDRGTTKWLLGKTGTNTFALYDLANSVYALHVDTSKHLGIFQTTPAATLDVLLADSGTNAISDVAILGHDTSGTAAAGFGGSLALKLEKGTTAAQNAGALEWSWVETATPASRVSLAAYDTGKREGLRIEGGGAYVKVGLFGVSAVYRQNFIAPLNAAYGSGDLDSEAEVIAALNATNTQVNAMLTALQNVGIMHTETGALVYDSFTRANGPLGNTETIGPDGQTCAALAWTGAGATIASNYAVITATGSEIIADPGLEGTYTSGLNTVFAKSGSPTVTESADAHGGSKAQAFTSTTASDNINALSAIATGTWFLASVWGKVVNQTAGITTYAARRAWGVATPVLSWSSTSWTQAIMSGRSTNNLGGIYPCIQIGGTSFDGLVVDDVSVQTLTLATLFASVDSLVADVIVDVTLASVTLGTQAGLVARLDDATTPANFLILYQDQLSSSGKIRLDQCVAGTYTNLLEVASTYAAGLILRLDLSGENFEVFTVVAGVATSKGTGTTAVTTGNLHGLFSTYSGNTLDNFTVMDQ